MSQITKIFDGTIAPDVETLSGDTGAKAGPDATFNIKLAGGPGIYTISDPLTNSVTIGRTEFLAATTNTTDAVPKAVLTFDMGTFPAVYTLDGKISARNVTDSVGGGYFFSAAFRTDGANGTLIGISFGMDFEEAAMAAADYDVKVSGNNIEIDVTGIVGKTIHWACEIDYVIAL